MMCGDRTDARESDPIGGPVILKAEKYYAENATKGAKSSLEPFRTQKNYIRDAF